MAKVLVLDVNNQKIYEAECVELEDFYKHLDSGCFDIVNREIGGVRYDIFCDDVGLFREDPIVSAVDRDTYAPRLVGNLVFANHDDQGETTSLSNDDVIRILSQITHGIDPRDGSVKMAVKVRY